MSCPDVAPAAWLAVYCLAAFLAAVGGGVVPSLVHLTHTRMQVAISFVAGLMLGLALLGPLHRRRGPAARASVPLA